ncbi:PREDICTED: uncharacterized protein LOC104600335 isoform X2 [Nelumbo nucifera]|uniref:Uncharacterized protein LOC104600335 isoform X2 n=1 Tax=Nelumbo nucifera TaxID=4432 RepID=A0A1U8A8T1_NELNU|nr:PREDICTED: uncharacterized protein LOC104600335 isoform X2 [Nelumbo nucifera]
MASSPTKRRRKSQSENDSIDAYLQKSSPIVVFAHSCGSPSTSDFMIKWRNMLRKALHAVEVITFDYPYIHGAKWKTPPPKAEELVDYHLDVVKKAVSKHPNHPLILAGKSMGSRVSCMVACNEDINVSAIVCLGYPLKGKNGTLRDETLLQLKIPVIFVQGSKDGNCPLDKLAVVRKKMKSANDLHVIDGGDHSFRIGKKHLELHHSTQDEAEDQAVKAIAMFIGKTLKIVELEAVAKDTLTVFGKCLTRASALEDFATRHSGHWLRSSVGSRFGSNSQSEMPQSSASQPHLIQQGTQVQMKSNQHLSSSYPCLQRQVHMGTDHFQSSSYHPHIQQQGHIEPSQIQSSSDETHLSQQGQPSSSYPQSPDSVNSQNPVSIPKTRGPTRCLDVWTMPEGQHISVAINKYKQPIGFGGRKLTTFLGTIARDGRIAPLTYLDWRAMPLKRKENMWQLVMAKFDIDPSSKSWVLKSIGKKWKDWKSELKKYHYLPHESDRERLADRDGRVLPKQWKLLVEFWNSEEGKARSATNKSNRAKQMISHTAGGKSFARVREEERAKRGEELTRAELFILTHTRKDGTPVDKASSLAILQLKEQHSQQSQGSNTRNDFFSQVMGEERRGRVRTFGLGPTPSDLWGPTPNPAEALKIASAAQKSADEKVQQMEEKMQDMQATVSRLQVTVTTLMSTLSANFPNINMADILGASTNPLNTTQAPVNADIPVDLPSLCVQSLSSSHEGSSP